MKAYICTVCSFLYDDESAEIGPDGKLMPFSELDYEEWSCPGCGVKANLFKETDSTRTADIPSDRKTILR
jgi:rubredoxin